MTITAGLFSKNVHLQQRKAQTAILTLFNYHLLRIYGMIGVLLCSEKTIAPLYILNCMVFCRVLVGAVFCMLSVAENANTDLLPPRFLHTISIRDKYVSGVVARALL
jgi:hypothetical protein